MTVARRRMRPAREVGGSATRMTVAGIGLGALMVVLALAASTVGLPFMGGASGGGTYTLGWQKVQQFEVRAKANQTITLEVNGVEGPSSTVKAYILAPDKFSPLGGPVGIDGVGKVSATVEQDGTYYVAVANSFVPEGERTVTFRYRVEPAAPGSTPQPGNRGVQGSEPQSD